MGMTNLKWTVADLGAKVEVTLGWYICNVDRDVASSSESTDLAAEGNIIDGGEDHIGSVN